MNIRPANRPASRFILAGSMPIHCLEWGAATAPVLLLLHGIGDNARVWDDIAGHLSALGLRVIVPDQRGHGLSGWADPPAYSCDDYVADLDKVVRSLQLTEFILMGHSMGALHATRYAAMSPGKARGLIHADIEAFPPDWNRKYLLNLYRELPHFYTSIDEYLAELRGNCPYADGKTLREIASSALVRGEDGRLRTMFHREVLSRFDTYDLRPCLSDIKCPALVIRGEESRVLGREAALRMSAAIPGGRFAEVPRAAHPLHLDNPAGFRQAVTAFLREAGLL